MSCRCHGITEVGKRCKRKRKYSEFCSFHEIKSSETCTVCFDPISEETVLECKHSFCKKCVLKWMCKNMNCPLCRSDINDISLYVLSIKYGLRNKLLLRMEKCYVNISSLPPEEYGILELLGLKKDTFMGEEEWSSMKTYIDPSILDKIIMWCIPCIMKIQEPEEYEYYKNFKKIYLFN